MKSYSKGKKEEDQHFATWKIVLIVVFGGLGLLVALLMSYLYYLHLKRRAATSNGYYASDEMPTADQVDDPCFEVVCPFGEECNEGFCISSEW